MRPSARASPASRDRAAASLRRRRRRSRSSSSCSARGAEVEAAGCGLRCRACRSGMARSDPGEHACPSAARIGVLAHEWWAGPGSVSASWSRRSNQESGTGCPSSEQAQHAEQDARSLPTGAVEALGRRCAATAGWCRGVARRRRPGARCACWTWSPRSAERPGQSRAADAVDEGDVARRAARSPGARRSPASRRLVVRGIVHVDRPLAVAVQPMERSRRGAADDGEPWAGRRGDHQSLSPGEWGCRPRRARRVSARSSKPGTLQRGPMVLMSMPVVGGLSSCAHTVLRGRERSNGAKRVVGSHGPSVTRGCATVPSPAFG